MTTSWEELTKQSESHDALSKPEVLAIMEILENKSSLTISEIHEAFTKNYNNIISRNQISYYIKLMESNEIIENGNNNEKEKRYSIVDITEGKKVEISIPQLIIFVLSIGLFLFHKDQFTYGIMMGVLVFLVLVIVEYNFYEQKTQKITLNLLNFKILHPTNDLKIQ